MGQLRIQRWFWALTSCEFFLAKRTFHQVMSVYGVPRDPPPYGLSFEAMVLDDLDYVTGAFDAYVDTSRDYSTWFVKYFAGPIIGDVLVSGGRGLGGAICTQVANEAEWRVCAETVEARVILFKALFTTREAHMQDEIAQVLA